MTEPRRDWAVEALVYETNRRRVLDTIAAVAPFVESEAWGPRFIRRLAVTAATLERLREHAKRQGERAAKGA